MKISCGLSRQERDHAANLYIGNGGISEYRQCLNTSFQIFGIERNPIDGLSRRTINNLSIVFAKIWTITQGNHIARLNKN